MRSSTVVVSLTVAVPVLAGAVLAAYIFLAPRIETYRHRVPFRSEQWKADSVAAGIWWPTRLRMADDLVDRGVLDGCPRTRVEELLGPPDTTPKWRDWNMVYRLGPERSLFSVDSEWLVIRLGAGGLVSEHRILTD